MDTKALRQKILDLAIRGKLVPQDPNDEPASVLLERIRTQKQQMVKDGKLKPKDIKNDTVIFVGEDNLHYEQFSDGTVKCIEDEIPFELPEGWAWCRLRDLFTVCSSKRVLQSEWKTSGIPFYRAREIVKLSENGFVDNDLFIAEEHYMRLLKDYGVPKAGDLMISGVGTIGKVYIVSENDKFYYKDASVLCFQNRTGLISPVFAKILLESYFMQSQMHNNSKGSTVDTITISSAMCYLCLLPPLKQQRKIADIISEYNIFIDCIANNTDEVIKLISKTKSKILDLAIRGKLVPQNPDDEPASVLIERIRAEKEELIKQGKIKCDKRESYIFRGEDNSYYEKIGSNVTCIDEELPFEIPDSWRWCRGANCFIPMVTRNPEGKSFMYIDIDSIDNERQKIKSAKLTLTQEAPSRASRAVFDGSVLFSLVRPYLKNIAIVDSLNANAIASTGFYVATSNGTYFSEFLYYLMISNYVVYGLNQFMKGDNSPSIRKDNIEKWLFPIPPIEEQKQIANIVNKYLNQIEKIEACLN